MQKANDVVTANTVMLSIILLAGVIIMVYGHIYKNNFITDIGIIVTGITVIVLAVSRIIFKQKSKRGDYYFKEFGDMHRRGKLK